MNIGFKNNGRFLHGFFCKMNFYFESFKFIEKIFFILLGLSIWTIYINENYQLFRVQSEVLLAIALTIICSVIFYFVTARYPEWRKHNQLRNSYAVHLFTELADFLLECEKRQSKIIELNQNYNVIEDMPCCKGNSINDIILYAIKYESLFLEKCDWSLMNKLNFNTGESAENFAGKFSNLYKKIKWAPIDIVIYRFLEAKDILIINSIFEEDEITLIKYLGERFSSCKEEFKILDIDIAKNIKTNIGEEYRSLIVAVDIVRNIRGFEQHILRNLEEKRKQK